MRNPVATGILFALCWPCVAAPGTAHAAPEQALVIRRAESGATLQELLAALEAQGGRARHIFPPDAAVVELPPGEPAEWGEDLAIHRGPVPKALVDPAVLSTRIASTIWNDRFAPPRRLAQDVIEGPHETLEERQPDAGIFPFDRSQPPAAGPSNLLSPGYYDTSEFFMDSIAVGVFLMESNGSAYNWSDSEVTQTLNGIYAAMDWWINRGGAAANLSFTYDLHIRQPTTYEPIQGPSSNDYLWVGEAMTGLGYSSTGIWQYLNDLRAARGTTWAYAIFVVDSSSVNQGRFTDGAYAWGYFGGPWLVMSRFSSWAYNAANYYQAVPAHETGHIFYATDEYDGYGQLSGYLNAHDNDGATCLMNQNSIGSLCAASTLQIGWRDSDGDGIHDILDTNPETTLAPFSPDPTTQTVLGYTGTATVVALTNQNPYGSGNDITLQTLTRVEFRVDSGAWSQAIPDDGTFDGPVESFQFDTPNLTPGSHTVEARAVSSVGNQDATPASDTVTVTAGTYTLTVTKAGTGTGTVTSSPAGINCGTDCSELYAPGTSVTLTATPAAGSTFTGWSGGCSGTGSCTIAMTAAQTVTATFSSSDVELQNNVALQDAMTATTRQGSWRYYWIDLASGSSNLVVDLYNLSADVDLYVRFGDKPILGAYNCRPYTGGLVAEQCSFALPAAGRWWIGVNNWDTGSIAYTVRASWSIPTSDGALSFYTVQPCRVFDSRNSSALASGETRQIQVTGLCSVPSSAKAVSLNLTVTLPGTGGYLTLWPSGTIVNTSSINFSAGETRANNAILLLPGQGTLSARPYLNAGAVHLILDVNGYFQ